jgi:RND family efflux transporter MFP subunit
MSRNDFCLWQLFLGLVFVGLTPVVQAQAVGSSGLDRQEIRAQLRPVRYTTLSAEIGAVVQSVLVKEGERFAPGAALIVLDCGLHEAQRAKSVAELAGAQRSLEANQRLAELNAAGLMELDLAKNTVEKSQAEMRISETQLSKCEIKAPFTGIVAEQRIREKQYVQPGTPLVDVLDDSGYELEFLAPSTWMSRLRVGMVVRIQIDEVRRNGWARIARISPRIDPVSQSIKVTANLEGPVADLKAGMSGRLQLP